MKTIRDRLNHLIEVLKLSKNEFAREIGSNGAMISKITTKDVNFGIDVFKKIIDRYPQLNHQWLMSGEGDIWLSSHNNEPQLYPQQSTDKLSKKITGENEPFPESAIKKTQRSILTARQRMIISENENKLIRQLGLIDPDYRELHISAILFERLRDVVNIIGDNYLSDIWNSIYGAEEFLQNKEFDFEGYKDKVCAVLDQYKGVNLPLQRLNQAFADFCTEYAPFDNKGLIKDGQEELGK